MKHTPPQAAQYLEELARNPTLLTRPLRSEDAFRPATLEDRQRLIQQAADLRAEPPTGQP